MKTIKKIFFVFLFVLVLTSTAQCAYCKITKQEFQVQTKDSKILKATLSYDKITNKKKYPTVLLLHSIGYSSAEWGTLISNLNNAGFAVIAMDLRGHGKSIYDSKFRKKSWVYFNTKTYQKIPSDVLLMLNEIQKQSKLVDANNMAIVGADIGANAAVIVSDKLKKKPKTLVLICPTRNFKGLYIPITMTNLNMPILTMASKKDTYSLQEQRNLAKFSQGGFYAQNYTNGGMGMLMIKVNPSMSGDITKWIAKYLH